MSRIPSVLQVGVGYWGKNHLRAWKKLENEGLCKLIGVQGQNQEKLRVIEKEFNVTTYSDDSGWIKADAIDIVIPTHAHYEVAKKALFAQKDILVEKPLTQTVSESEDLKRICHESGQIVMAGHLFRYNPAVERAKKLIETGEIGDIRFLRGQFMGFRNKEYDAGILATTAIHFIYLANYFVGSSPKAVAARLESLLDPEFEDRCLIHLEYEGVSATIESDYFSPGKWRTFNIVGTQGIIEMDTLGQKVVVHKKRHVMNDGRFIAVDEGEITLNIPFQEPLILELRHFLDCIGKRNEPRTGIDDAIDALRVVEAGYESSRFGGKLVVL